VQRICFQLKVRPDRIDEYVKRHANVWPEMRQALHDSGWNNYSLFLQEDGTLIGYLETDDFEAAQQKMAVTEVNERWQREMGDYFVELEGDAPDTSIAPLREIFHVD
jgi:L-rhamnose mutarotase